MERPPAGPFVPLLLLSTLLLAPPSAADGGEVDAGLVLAADRVQGGAAVGGVLTLLNGRPWEAWLDVSSPQRAEHPDAPPALAPLADPLEKLYRLAPYARVEVPFRAWTDGRGDRFVLSVAVEERLPPPGATPFRAAFSFPVLQDPPPRVRVGPPTPLALEAGTGVEVPLFHGREHPVRVPVEVETPPGWVSSVFPHAATLEVRPGPHAGQILFAQGAGADAGTATLRVGWPGDVTVLEVPLRPSPVPEGKALPDPARLGTRQAGAPWLALRLDPPVQLVPPGGSADARLLVENLADEPVQVGMGFASHGGFGVDLRGPGPFLPPRARAAVDLVVHVAPSAAHPSVASAGRIILMTGADARPSTLDVPVVVGAPSTLAPPAHDAPLPPPGMPHVLSAAAGAGAALLAWRHRRFLLAFLALRLRGPREPPDAQPHRAAILARVGEQPGVLLADLRRDLALARGTVRHHVRTLEKAGLVGLVRDGRLVRLYPAPPRAPALLLRDVMRGEAWTLRSLQAALGEAGLPVKRGKLRRWLASLAEEGAVVVHRRGRALVYRVAARPERG